jgi:uncharacterized protein
MLLPTVKHSGRCGCSGQYSYRGMCALKKTDGIAMPVIFRTVLLLMLSNIFMTYAWYGHLKILNNQKWYIAALVSWSIALFEYLLQVPANRMGYTQLSVSQLKIIQEVISLSVFAPFAVLYLHQPFKRDYLWAGLCLLGAVYFMFRS